MVTLPKRAVTQYRLYLVQPIGDFQPTNWQQKPSRFEIVSRLATSSSLGKIDSAKFLFNNTALSQPRIDSWYVVLS